MKLEKNPLIINYALKGDEPTLSYETTGAWILLLLET